MKPLSKLSQRQVERRLSSFRPLIDASRVRPGWVAFIRQAFGMSQRDLAKVAKLSASSVAQIELREEKGTVTIATLQKLARAIDCEVIYAIVPRQPITDLLQARATAKARLLLKAASVHMDLEDQSVTSNYEERVELLAETLLKSGDIW